MNKRPMSELLEICGFPAGPNSIFIEHITDDEGLVIEKHERIRDKDLAVSTWCNGGNVKLQTSYKNVVRHGVSREFHPNGNVKKETHYVFGEKHGIEQTWDEDKNLLSKSKFSRGVLNPFF